MPASKKQQMRKYEGIEHVMELMAEGVPRVMIVAQIISTHKISQSNAYQWVSDAEEALVPVQPEHIVHMRAQIDTRLVNVGNEARVNRDYASSLKAEELRMRLHGLDSKKDQIGIGLEISGGLGEISMKVMAALAEAKPGK
jgi:hypothetical protein